MCRRKLEHSRKLAVNALGELEKEREKWRARKRSWLKSKRKHIALRGKYQGLVVRVTPPL